MAAQPTGLPILAAGADSGSDRARGRIRGRSPLLSPQQSVHRNRRDKPDETFIEHERIRPVHAADSRFMYGRLINNTLSGFAAAMKSQASIAGFTTSGQLLLACLLSLATATPPAKAYTIYSGLDPNLSGNNTPMTGNVPNSDAARDAFFARLNGVGTETFQSFTGSAGGSLPPSPFTIDFNSVDALIVDEGNSARIYNAPDGNGAYAISSTNYARFSIPQGGSGTSFYIDLTNPAGAFGFYTTDLNNTSRLDLEISNAGGVISTLTAFPSTSLALRPSGSTTYFGFLADSSAEEFTRVRFLVSGSNDVIGFDNFSVGTLAQVEPAPGPLPLLGAAAAFGWSRRLRRRCRDRSPDPSTD